MAEIGIIGSGNVGANTAFFIAEKGLANARLFDIQNGLADGKSLDMMEAAPIRAYQFQLHGVPTLDAIKESEIIILAAGTVRKPGTKREDLFETNKAVIQELASQLADYRGIVIVVTEPVDLLSGLFAKESGLPAKRILGLGGLLDSTRLRHALSRELGITTENIVATVVGRHSDAMIPLKNYCCVSGVPIGKLMDASKISDLFEETRKAGDLIVEMAQRASAYYGPSAAAADLCEAILNNSRQIMPVSLIFTGQYGIEGPAMSLPAVIGKNGIEEVLEPELSEEEKRHMQDSAKELQEVLGP